MKTLIISACVMLLASQSFAQSSFSCREIYQRTADHKLDIRDNYKLPISGEATFYASGALVIHPVVASITVAIIASAVYANSTPREQKILEAGDEANRFSRRLLRKVNKKVSADVVMEDIARYVEEGLESGDLCSKFPKLYSKSDLRKMVLRKASAEFGVN